MTEDANSNDPTELGSLGEFGLIDHLTGNNKTRHEQTIKAVGDDAAVIGKKGGVCALWSTDSMVEGIHYDLLYTPLKHLGYKAVVTAISDIYAMNGTPKQITVSLALSNRMSVEALEEMYEGIYLACDVYELDLVGGDTTSSLSGTVINVGVLGEAKEEEICYRDGARENDILLVTGDLGAAFLGLQLLEREKKLFNENPDVQPDFSGYDYLLERQLKPEARKEAIEDLKKLGIKPTSMIDISDGLSSECLHLARNSGVGFSIYEDKIPVDPVAVMCAEEFRFDPVVCALNGGEDYELLMSVKLDDFTRLKDHKGFIPVGHITPEKGSYKFVSRNNTESDLTAQGWDAILKQERDI